MWMSSEHRNTLESLKSEIYLFLLRQMNDNFVKVKISMELENDSKLIEHVRPKYRISR